MATDFWSWGGETVRYKRQVDIAATWPDDGRPNPWAAGNPMSWPIVHRSDRGDVWQVAADRFALQSQLGTEEYPSLARAIQVLGG